MTQPSESELKIAIKVAKSMSVDYIALKEACEDPTYMNLTLEEQGITGKVLEKYINDVMAYQPLLYEWIR